MFVLDSRLELDTFLIAELEISKLLLMNDSNYLWLILVPRIAGAKELIDLDFRSQTKVLQEINLISKIVKENFACEKLNIAALGNVVSQLHIHIIARRKNDAAFPKPVWGNSAIKFYQKEQAQNLILQIQNLINSCNKKF
jgi:diadenosine tetraphosphate (Ap4A) HIT family hydrolase